MERDYQRVVNRMGRATTGTFQSTSLGTVMAESKLAPAGPLLEYRQAKFTQRTQGTLRPGGNLGEKRHGANREAQEMLLP